MVHTFHDSDLDGGAAGTPPAPRVLIAIDDTPAGRRTLASGLAQAAAQGADVTVLHVVPGRHWRVGRFGPVRAVPMRLRDTDESAPLRRARRVAFDYGIRPGLELIAGEDVDAIIVGTAARLRADAIVVGGRRAERLSSGVTGVCQGVLRRAPVPVTVVPA
jgi:nucleotide-binding universal stress UspA family protein